MASGAVGTQTFGIFGQRMNIGQVLVRNGSDGRAHRAIPSHSRDGPGAARLSKSRRFEGHCKWRYIYSAGYEPMKEAPNGIHSDALCERGRMA